MAVLHSILFRKARNQVAGIVTYYSKGQTISRELPSRYTNPRTNAQMLQRMRLANPVQLWKRMAPWANHGAFQNKRFFESEYNAFCRVNLMSDPVYLTKTQVERGASVIAPLVISSGGLVPIVTNISVSEDYAIADIFTGTFDGTGTLGDLAQAIIDNNNGIKQGDQLSLIVAIQQSTSDVPYCIVRSYEWTLDVTDRTAYTGSSVAQWLLSIYDEDHPTQRSLAHEVDANMSGYAFILSRKSKGRLLVSNATLVLTEAATTFYRSFGTTAAYQAAVASYGSESTDFLAPGDVESVPAEEGGSSNVPTVLSINSVNIDGVSYPAGSVLYEPSANVTQVQFNFNQSVADKTPSQVVVSFSDSTPTITITAGLLATGAILRASFGSTDAATLKTKYNRISSFVATLDNVNYTFNVNGGQADPGDITP